MEEAGSPKHFVAQGRPGTIVQPAKEKKRKAWKKKKAFTGVGRVGVCSSFLD